MTMVISHILWAFSKLNEGKGKFLNSYNFCYSHCDQRNKNGAAAYLSTSKSKFKFISDEVASRRLIS